MSQHVVFVGTYEIPDGKLDEWKAAIQDMTEFVRENEPRLLRFNSYANPEGTEATTIQVHPDSASLEHHLEVAGSRVRSGVQLVRVKRIELYGTPSAQVVEQLRHAAGISGDWPVIVKGHVQGFPD
jgi:hypothetical protein